MAMFNPNSVNSIKDESIRNYLQELNENLTYMFNNLTPDDNNAKSVPKLTVVKDDNGESHIEVTAGGIVISANSGVQEDELIAKINSQLEVSTTGITISTNGKFTINTPSFNLDQYGNINVNNKFIVSSTGSVTANDIVLRMSGSASVGSFGTCHATNIDSNMYTTNDHFGMQFMDEYQEDYRDLYCQHCYQYSDRRAKENIVNISEADSIGILKDLKPVTFNFINGSDVNAGFIAQDVESAFKEHNSDIKVYSLNHKGYYTLDYPMFVPIIISALQYILKKVDNA